MIESDWSCLTERLTLIVSAGSRGNRSWRSAPWRQASKSDPAADRNDQARLLGERDELRGRDQAPRRDGSSATAPRRRSRCAVRGGRRAGSRPRVDPARGRAAFRREARGARPRARAWSARIAGSCPCCRASPCTSRRRRCEGAPRRSWASEILVAHADADAGAGVHLFPFDHDRLLEGVEHAVGNDCGLVTRVDLVEQNGELVAAEAGDRVGGAHGAAPAGEPPRRAPRRRPRWPRLSFTVLKSSRSMKHHRKLHARAVRADQGVGSRGRQRARGWRGLLRGREMPDGRAAPRTPCAR